MSDRIGLVDRLLHQHPSKARELLVDYCQREDVRLKILEFIDSHPESSPYARSHSPPARLDTTFESQTRSARFNARNLDPPNTHRAPPRQVFSNVAPDLPLSPDRTPSVTSHSTYPESSGRESIFLLSCDDDDDENTEKQAYCRSAPIDHNLITDDAVRSRAQKAVKLLPAEVDIRIPNSSGSFRLAKARFGAYIVWRRRKVYKTIRTFFHIVPVRYLDTDIIFTLQEATAGLQHSPEYQDTFVPHAQSNRGFVFGELDPKVPTPRSVISPHIPPELLDHLPHDVQHHFEHIEHLAARQRTHDVSAEDIHMRHGSPMQTVSVPKFVSTEIDPRQRHHMATSPTATASGKEHDSSAGQIRLTGRWGNIPINLRMDLNATGEVFYQTFYRWAEERNRKIERERTKLWLRKDKSIPEELRFDFGLGEEELEEVWEAVVDWVQENKREKGPHIYVDVKTGTE